MSAPVNARDVLLQSTVPRFSTQSGQDGLTTATVFIYQRNNTGVAPAVPSANATYTFNPAGLTGLTNGWSFVPPDASAGAFLYVSRAMAASTGASDVLASLDWSAAQIMAKDGVPGVDGANGSTSLYPPLTDIGWSNVYGSTSIVAVTDGPAGATSRRSATAVDTELRHATLIPIDRTRTYRTRFWTRAVNSNGELYFCLRQMLSDGSPGPVNNGRAPYKPSPAYAGANTVWTEHSFTWSASDWQAGVTQVYPDFLMNYRPDGVARTGYWEIQDFQMQDVTEVVAAQTAATAAAAQAALANAELANVVSDNVLSKGEKADVTLRWNTITGEFSDIVAKAAALSVSSTAYSSAKASLETYLASLNDWSNPAIDTAIVGTTFRSMFKSYYDAKIALLNAITAKAATVANWSGVVNRPPDSAIYNNLIDLGWWKRDAAFPWPLNLEYNRIVMTGTDVGGTGPKGVDDCVWFMQETTGNGDQGGGWDSAPITLDPTKTYRFVVPIRRIDGTGQTYWGTENVCTLNTTTAVANPYFASASLAAGKWYLMIGYLYPAGSTGNLSTGAGIFDCDTGEAVAGGTNYNMKASETTYYHRAYQYYSTANAKQVFGRPMVNCVDGTEPSLREYFSASAVMNSALIPSITAAQNTANSAVAGLANKLNKNADDILGGVLSINAVASPAGFRAGSLTWDANGSRVSGSGIAVTPAGIVGYSPAGALTFYVDATNGGAYFGGQLLGATGTFSGALNAASGTFTGNLSGASGTFSGSLTASEIITTDNISNDAVSSADIFGAISAGNNGSAFVVSRANTKLTVSGAFGANGGTNSTIQIRQQQTFDGVTEWVVLAQRVGPVNTTYVMGLTLNPGTYYVYVLSGAAANAYVFKAIK